MYSCCDHLITRIVCAWITVTWDKGIWMRVSLFGLFLRCTSLMEPWPKLVQSVLLVIGFISDFLFYDDYDILVHTCYTCVLTPCFLNLITFVIFTLVLILARHLAFALHSPGEFHLTPLDSYVQVLELGARGFPCWGPSLLLWSGQISCSSSPILAPLGWLAIPPAISWAPFALFIYVYPLYSRICACQVM